MNGNHGIRNDKTDALLSKIYYDPSHPGSFGGINALKRIVGNKVSENQLKNWLSTQDTYTLHKPVRHHFKRKRILVSDIDEQWEADLVDLSGLARYNKNFKYLLTVIDTLSKYAWAIPLKTKTGNELVSAFSKLLRTSKRVPEKLRSDKGGEFINKKFQKFLKTKNIHFFTSNNEVKAAIVERFNRTLKTKMWKYFSERNTLSYMPILKKLLHSYNNTWHRSIKRKPIDVNEENASDVWQTLYSRGTTSANKDIKFKFNVGDKVRISKTKMVFEKGYLPNWTTEIFIIKRRIKGNPPVYLITDEEGETILGTFYEPELQKVSIKQNKIYKIERILGEKGKGKKKSYFIKWEGYPSKFNSWVSASEIKNL